MIHATSVEWLATDAQSCGLSAAAGGSPEQPLTGTRTSTRRTMKTTRHDRLPESPIVAYRAVKIPRQLGQNPTLGEGHLGVHLKT
jgi:hypothetical protein